MTFRILTVTTFFPNSVNPHRTVFVKNLVKAMIDCCEPTVVAPVPYAPPLPQVPRWYAQRSIPSREIIDGVEVMHPRFLAIPKLVLLTGLGYFLGILPLLRRLKHRLAPDLIHVHCGYPDAVGAALAARVLGIPYVVTLHGSDINIYSRRRDLAWQMRWALAGAAGVVAVSNGLLDKVTRLTGGRLKSVRCIPCAGFDPEVFHPRSPAECRVSLGLPGTARVIVFVGTLVPIKGVDLLIDAWATLARDGRILDADRLLIIGHGYLRDELQRRAQASGIEGSVEFAGAMPQREVALRISAATALCLASHNEGMPNVIVEAMASGIPVVSTRVGGIPDLVDHGNNGLLVEPGDAPALADALADAMNRQWDRDRIRQSVDSLTWKALGARNCAFLASALASVS